MKKYYKYRNKKEKNIFLQAISNSSIVNITVAIGLFFGGILFLSYYFYIGYMPQINNFTDFTYMLFAMAIVGLFLFIILLSLFIFPSFFYDKFFEGEMKKVIDMKMFIYSMSIIPSIMIVYLVKEIWFKEFNFTGWLFYGGLFIFGILLPSILYKDSKTLTEKIKWERTLYVMMQAMVSYLSILIYIIFILSKQTNISTNTDALITFFLFSVGVIVVNIFLANDKFRKKKIKKILLVVASFFLLMILFRAYSLVPSVVMNQFHLGNFVVEKINAKERSCKILLDLNSSDFIVTQIDKSNKGCTIEAFGKNGKICVLSKIGLNMLFQVEVVDKDITIELPKEDFSGMVVNRNNNRRCLVYKNNSDANKMKKSIK